MVEHAVAGYGVQLGRRGFVIKVKKKAAASNAYNWRPNFRNYDDLPDLRTVRTQFFFPVVSLCVAAVFTLFILFQEFRAKEIRRDIERLEEEIASYEASHDEKVKKNAEFMAISRTIDEVLEFESDRLVGSDYLLSLSSNLLEGMYLTRVEFLSNLAVVEGSVQVAAAEASEIVNEYLKAIEEADALQGMLNEYKLTSLERGAKGNVVNFRIEIKQEEGAGKK